MSLSVTTTTEQPMPSMEQRVPESSTIAHIDSLPTSPSLYSDDPDYESRSKIPTMLSPATAKAPALPERSARRVSRMLDGLIPHKLASEDQPRPLTTQSMPHDIYLSSEEDASSSADDFSDFETESSSEEPQQAIRRGSQKDTARVVSVIFSGKPNIVDLPRRSISPSSASDTSRPPSRLRRTSTLPIVDRRVSMCSSPSGSSIASSPSVLHPPRTSSMLPSRRLEKQKPQFLNIDPFAAKHEDREENMTPSNIDPKVPKTPGMFKRTLSLVKKRSRPSLNTHFSSLSRDNLSNLLSPQNMEQVREESTTTTQSVPAPLPTPVNQGPVTYHDIVMSAKQRSRTMPMSPISPLSDAPGSPMTPNGSRHRLRFSSARRRSIKA